MVLPGTRAAGDDDVEPRAGGQFQNPCDLRRKSAKTHKLCEIHDFLAEFPDRHVRAVQRQRREYDVHPGAIHQPGIDHRTRLIDASADPGGDALTDIDQMRGVAEMRVRQENLAATFDEDFPWPVHHDVIDGVVRQQRLQRTQAGDVMHQFLGQFALFPCIQIDPAFCRDFRNQTFDIVNQPVTGHTRDRGRIQPGKADACAARRSPPMAPLAGLGPKSVGGAIDRRMAVRRRYGMIRDRNGRAFAAAKMGAEAEDNS